MALVPLVEDAAVPASASFRDGNDRSVESRASPRDSLERLLATNHVRIARLAVGMGVPRGDVDDLVQDVFVEVLRGLGGFRGESSEETWVRSIAIRRIRRYFRWRWVRRILKPMDPTVIATPDERIDDETGQLTREAVALLPEHYREVIVLRYFEECSIEEVGETLGIARSAVDMRLSRARGMLRTLLKSRGIDAPLS